MNRIQRRVARARERKARATAQFPKANIVAAHEAGHAIARYLTAAEMGYSPEEAITSIEFAAPDATSYAGTSFDGKAQLYTQATTFGPMLTKEMGQMAKRVGERMGFLPGKTLGGREGFNHLSQIISEARADGVDIEPWLQARAVIAVMGSAVEALVRNKPFFDIWESHESEHDLIGFVEDCTVAEVPASEISSRIDAAVERAIELLKDSHVIAAVNALATQLLQHGTTDGKTAARIIGDEMRTEAVKPSHARPSTEGWPSG